MRRAAAMMFGLALVGVAGSAGAQAPAADGQARALELYEESREQYELGDYSAAAELLEQAYELYAEPNLLYNLARAYGNLGDFERAIDAYEALLEAAPDTRDRAVIEARIRNYREVLARRQAEREAEARRRRAALEQARDSAAPPRRADPAPWVLAGGGVAVLIAGAILGALSLDARSEAEMEPSFTTARQASDRAVTYAWLANGGFVLGGVLATVGVIWGIVDVASSGGASRAAAQARLRVRGGALELSW